jgi:hypothetical protein
VLTASVVNAHSPLDSITYPIYAGEVRMGNHVVCEVCEGCHESQAIQLFQDCTCCS